jgi:hypothetical protein
MIKRFICLSALAVSLAGLSRAGQVIQFNYTIGTPVFPGPSSTATFTNGDTLTLNAVFNPSTNNQALNINQTVTNITLFQLTYTTTASTAAGGVAQTDNEPITLGSSSTPGAGLTVSSPNPLSLAYSFTVAANHVLTVSALGPAQTYIYSDLTRLTITPTASTGRTGAGTVSLLANVSYAAPEPATFVLFGAGLVGFALIRRRKS